ncbi:hypothetical protein [Bartonella sp. OT172YNZD]|uniref:hypothetical protein n=1 Tax=Bartonella sp. OT172YNZD TaxID=3243572 RepID=UPI0035D12D7A
MVHDLIFWLLLGFFCFFALALILFIGLQSLWGLQGGCFGDGGVLYGFIATPLGFVYVGAGRCAVRGELLLKGAGCFLAFFQLSLAWCIWASRVTLFAWQVFLKAVMFCCMMGFILWLAYFGTRNIDVIEGIFLKVLLFVALLKVLLVFLYTSEVIRF